MEPDVEQQCQQCQITKTPKWRTGPLGPKTLCNACGLRYKKEKEEPKSKAPQGQGQSKAKKEASAQGQPKPTKGHYKALRIRATPY